MRFQQVCRLLAMVGAWVITEHFLQAIPASVNPLYISNISHTVIIIIMLLTIRIYEIGRENLFAVIAGFLGVCWNLSTLSRHSYSHHEKWVVATSANFTPNGTAGIVDSQGMCYQSVRIQCEGIFFLKSADRRL